MTKFNEKFQMLFMAATYAESGEFNTAREIIEYKETKKLQNEKKLAMRIRVNEPRARI